MNRRGSIWGLASAGALLASLALCPLPPQDECTCWTARRIHGWCDFCWIGYVAGLPIRGRLLYELVDSHGHDIDATRLPCEKCRTGRDSSAFCETCGVGLVSGKAYLSKLGFALARGIVTSAADVKCALCKKNLTDHGWCDACRRGAIGNTLIPDKNLYTQAAAEWSRLKNALPFLPRCEWCAIASFTDTRCPNCRLDFRDGRPVESPPSKP